MNKLYFSLVVICLLFSGSCKKNTVDNETVSTTDYALATQEFMQIFLNVNESCTHQKGIYSPFTITVLPTCRADSVTGDTTHDLQGTFTNTSSPPLLWMQYTNCQGPDGKTRNGTIKVSFSQQYNIVGSIATITLSNYTVNGVLYQGTISLTRNVNNSFVYSLINGVCVSKTKQINYNCNYIIAFFDNGNTNNLGDDYAQVLGNSNGKNREGKPFDLSISDPIIKRTDCSWISQGKANLTPEGLHVRAVDFGGGICDDVASFVVDGQTFTVHMSK